MRSIAEKRHLDRKAEENKLRKIKSFDPLWSAQFVGQEHRLSKGKIHCSCPLCSFKGVTMQDRRNLVKFVYDEEVNDIYVTIRHNNRNNSYYNR